MHLSHDILIARDPGTIFDYIAEPNNLPEWQPDVLDVIADSPRPVTVGFRWQEVRRVLGRPDITTMEVTTCEPARLFRVRSITAPVPVAVTHELVTEAQQTRLSLAINGRLGASASLVGPLAKLALDRHLRASCQRLRDLLERSRPR